MFTLTWWREHSHRKWQQTCRGLYKVCRTNNTTQQMRPEESSNCAQWHTVCQRLYRAVYSKVKNSYLNWNRYSPKASTVQNVWHTNHSDTVYVSVFKLTCIGPLTPPGYKLNLQHLLPLLRWIQIDSIQTNYPRVNCLSNVCTPDLPSVCCVCITFNQYTGGLCLLLSVSFVCCSNSPKLF